MVQNWSLREKLVAGIVLIQNLKLRLSVINLPEPSLRVVASV